MAEKKKGPSKHSQDMQWEIEKRLQDRDMPMPHEFLADIMCGIDPRKEQGRLFELVKSMAADENEDGLPSYEAWEALKQLVFEKYKSEKVYLTDSMNASKELMQYMYPKKKSVEVSGDLAHLVKVVPLTKEEIDTFEKRFLDEF